MNEELNKKPEKTGVKSEKSHRLRDFMIGVFTFGAVLGIAGYISYYFSTKAPPSQTYQEQVHEQERREREERKRQRFKRVCLDSISYYIEKDVNVGKALEWCNRADDYSVRTEDYIQELLKKRIYGIQGKSVRKAEVYPFLLDDVFEYSGIYFPRGVSIDMEKIAKKCYFERYTTSYLASPGSGIGGQTRIGRTTDWEYTTSPSGKRRWMDHYECEGPFWKINATLEEILASCEPRISIYNLKE